MHCPSCGADNHYTKIYCIYCGGEFTGVDSEQIKQIIEKSDLSKNWECVRTIYTPDPGDLNRTEVKSLSLHYYGEILAVVRKIGALEIKRLDREENYTLNNPDDNYKVLDAAFPAAFLDSTISVVESIHPDFRNLLPDSLLELYSQEKKLDAMDRAEGINKDGLLNSLGNKLVSLDSDGKIRIRDFMQRKTIIEIKVKTTPNSKMILSNDNKRIAVTNENIEIKGISPEIPKTTVCKNPLHSFPSTVRFFADGKRLLSACSLRIGVWNTSLGELIRSLSKNQSPISSLCFSGTDKTFVSGDEKGGLVVWDAVNLSFIRSPGSNMGGKAPGKINDICFIPGTDYFFTASENRIIILWKIDEDMRICSLEGHKGPVTALCISRDGKTLISGDKSGEIKIWKPCS